MSQTKTLAAYGAALRYEDIPSDVLNRAKNLTLQTLGVSLGALGSDVGRRAVELGRIMGGGSSEATIWGEGSKVSAAAAGLANGTLAESSPGTAIPPLRSPSIWRSTAAARMWVRWSTPPRRCPPPLPWPNSSALQARTICLP